MLQMQGIFNIHFSLTLCIDVLKINYMISKTYKSKSKLMWRNLMVKSRAADHPQWLWWIEVDINTTLNDF